MISVMLRQILRPGFALIAFALAGTSTAAESRYSFDATPGKLPKTVVPTHYTIELEPNLESLTLVGVEVIDIEVREPTAHSCSTRWP
jgi:aminopeptidase N